MEKDNEVTVNSPQNEKQGSKTKPQKLDATCVDVIIIGAGPAGLTAAIYAARAGAKVLVIENGSVGGQMTQSPEIKNYPGFEEISGAELSRRMRDQAQKSGAVIDEFAEITSVDLQNKIILSGNKRYRAKAVVIATGAKQVELNVPGASRFNGKGVHYCALCDGHLYKGKAVAVVGGGSSALTEALYLSNIAEKVYILRRKDFFKADKVLLEEVEKSPGIEIYYNTDILSLEGESKLETIRVVTDGKESAIAVSGLFVYIGSTPQTDLFNRYVTSGEITLDAHGYIKVDESCSVGINNVYAAGDVCSKHIRQISTAIADGAVAGSSASSF
jgi:thioredoxin reductase (NADPH)